MHIAIIGSGNVGGTLGRRWAQTGHTISFGVRNPHSPKVQSALDATGGRARADSVAGAVRAAEIVVLATPWEAAQSAIAAAGNLAGKVLIDTTNPLAPGLSGLACGTDTSAGEKIAEWAPAARVVKAFNTSGFNTMADPLFGSERATMIICGEDSAAKAVVGQLARELGFELEDAGGDCCRALPGTLCHAVDSHGHERWYGARVRL